MPVQTSDYKDRTYLSSIEAAKFLDITVKRLHKLVKQGKMKVTIAASGQKRFDLKDLKRYERRQRRRKGKGGGRAKAGLDRPQLSRRAWTLDVKGTKQKVLVKSSTIMRDVPSESVHLMITSPPYFDTKMYSRTPEENDLGNIHDMDDWFEAIGRVWKETYRVLAPGRKAFINIMNLPVRTGDNKYRTLNLVGRTVDLCEEIGFIFKRDIVWQKTNAVRAHFGTYPYPGGILINNMHEFILELEKPAPASTKKYAHVTQEQKERSRLTKNFWIDIKKSDVWVMRPQGSGDRRSHIAPFPLELPERLVRAFSYIGETVLDPFVGSGTTLMAAANWERNGIGYEINPDIAWDAVKALRRMQRQGDEGKGP